MVSVVRTSMGRMRNALQAFNMLAESCLGSFLSYFGLWTGALVSGLERKGGASIGSSILVLLSSTASTLNLFTGND